MLTNRVWRPIRPLALFNLADEPRTLRYLWKDLGLPAARHRLRQLAESIDNSKPSQGRVRSPFGIEPIGSAGPLVLAIK
jgi:hypothetical protein